MTDAEKRLMHFAELISGEPAATWGDAAIAQAMIYAAEDIDFVLAELERLREEINNCELYPITQVCPRCGMVETLWRA